MYFLFGEISAYVFYRFLIELFDFVTLEFLSVRASVVAQLVKNLPALWETWVRSLGWEDPLEREWQLLQYSCLENPMDKGAWRAAVHGVRKSWTRLND